MRTMRGRTAPRGERLRAGDVLLGRYTVLSELGEGGMGVVYRCLDSVGGIEVALKCLPPELSRNEAEMEGVRENYAIVARLRHSAISGLRQLEKDPAFGEYYLVMDLAEGEDLSAVLRRRRGAPMPPAEAFAILRPLASALDYAHGEKVLHRDVKPANVKVATAGGASRPGEPALVTRHSSPVPSQIRVQLLDFGLAAEVRSSMSRVSLRGHAGSSGTPAYMAPEQWEARPQSAATDQYALAVMAYQMLSGSLPFDADDTDLLRRAVLSRAPDPVPGLSRAANAALLRALAKDPAARFPSCTAFVDALSRGVHGGRLAGTARPTRSRFALAAAALLAAAGALWFARSRVESHAESAEGAEAEKSETRIPNPAANPESRNPNPAAGEASRPGEPPVPASGEGALSERAASDLPATGGASRPGEPQGGGGLQTAEGRQDAGTPGRQEAARSENAPSLPPPSATLEELKADDDSRAEIALLRAAAIREAEGVAKMRKWTSGGFKARFEELDAAASRLSVCSNATDISAAKTARADVSSAAEWIRSAAAEREKIEAAEKRIDALKTDLASTEAERYAASTLYKARSALADAAKCRDRDDFSGALGKLSEAEALFGEAVSSASAERAAEEAKRKAVEERRKEEEGRARSPSAPQSAPAARSENAPSQAGDRFVAKVGSVSIPFRWCPPGSFTMGSPSSEEGRVNVETQYRVTLTKGFWMGETEVTQGQWKTFMDGETILDLARKALRDDSEYIKGGKRMTLRSFYGKSRDDDPSEICGDSDDSTPVYHVSWDDARSFCRRLTECERSAGRLPTDYEYRLPTEAEWEYACRAGTTTSLPNGRDIVILGQYNAPALDEIAWYGGNSSVGFDGRGWDTEGCPEKQYRGGKAAPRKVGTRKANDWGLYDMIGNVSEWCADWYGPYPSDAATDPKGLSSGLARVCRGGSWIGKARVCRSACRFGELSGYRFLDLGFRVALAPVQ